MNAVVALNRVMWVVLLATATAAAAVSMWRPGEAVPEVEPEDLKVARFEQLSFREPVFLERSFRNLFDPDGSDWSVKAEAEPAPAPQPKTRWPEESQLVGVVRLPDVTGVLTADGFIPIGAMWRGVMLTAIEDGKVVLRSGEQSKELPLPGYGSRKSSDYSLLEALVDRWPRASDPPPAGEQAP